MANTTFSGPIRTGSITQTTGTSVGTDVKNIGWVQNSQAFFVSIGDTTVSTTVVIPARSMITAIHGHVTEIFNSGTSDDFDIGTTRFNSAVNQSPSRHFHLFVHVSLLTHIIILSFKLSRARQRSWTERLGNL